MLRIALAMDVGEVNVSGAGGITAHGGASFRFAPGESIRLTRAARGVSAGDRAGSAESFAFESRDRTQFITVNGRSYRGSLEVYPHGEALIAVNVVGLEAYLRGVVAAEMGTRNRNEMAALEAQAIVSRTYALKNRGRFRADGYDLRAGVSDQAYMGVERETSLGSTAVRNTTGLVVTYRGDLINAFFHSTCGYSTASPEEAFRTVSPTPYLKPVSDRRPSGGYYCDISPRFRWTVEWGGAELRDILQRTVPSVLGVDATMVDEIRNLHVHSLGRSRRVTELRVEVSRGEIPVYGPDLRSVFLTPDNRPLGSTAIEMAVRTGSAGLESATATGAGWGHGVGMCQWGAVGRARAGQSAREIITTYFPGTSIERWY